MTTQFNTLQDYIENYIKQALTVSHDKKSYRELIDKVEEIIKFAIKHQDGDLASKCNNSHSQKKLFHILAKYHIAEFLNNYSVKKECIQIWEKNYHLNDNDLKILKEAEDIVNEINNINLSPHQTQENETLNLKKKLSQTIHPMHDLKSCSTENFESLSKIKDSREIQL